MSLGEGDKPPGTGYALVDWRLARIEQQLLASAAETVPIGIYNVNQQVITEKFAELMKLHATEEAVRAAAIVALHARIDTSEARVETNRQNIEKGRKQFWLTVTAGVLVAVVNLFGNPIGQLIIGAVNHK